MIGMFEKFLPFGQYFYLDVRDNLEDFKELIKRFSVVKLRRDIDSEKLLSINVLSLIDFYIPPVNALLIIKVLDQSGEERFLLEISNYPEEVFSVHESGISAFVSENEKLVIEFYALDDNLFLESIKRFKNLYEEKGAINAMKDMNNEIKNLASSIGYELNSSINIERFEIAKKFIQIIENLIIEEEAN